MKWPFVSRSLYDDAVADLRKRLNESEADRRKLTKTVVRMKLTGGFIPRAAAGVRLEQRERDPIEKAVDENPRAQQDPALRRHLLSWARQQQQANVDIDVILTRLRTWSVVGVEDDDDDDEVIAI